MPMADEPLTDKQKLFAAEFQKDFNGTQAAIRAKYSKHTAAQQASRLLRNVKVQDAIRAGIVGRVERLEVSADWVLERLTDEAAARIGELYDDCNCLLPVKEWPDIWQTGLVAGVETYEEYEDRKDKDGNKTRIAIGRTVKLKLSDRIKRVELIGKHSNINAFRENVKHDITENAAKVLMQQVSGLGIRPRE